MQQTEEKNLLGRDLLWMSLLSLIFYTGLSYLVFRYLREEPLAAAFRQGVAWQQQLGWGLLGGAVAALIIAFLAGRDPVRRVLDDFYIFRQISRMSMSPFDRLQVSLFAGVGEELLFRGALQPVLGIWITSIIFVGIHGYFKFRTGAHIFFGLMMFSLSMLLGILYQELGLISAMTAHAVYDVLMLWWARRFNSQKQDTDIR